MRVRPDQNDRNSSHVLARLASATPFIGRRQIAFAPETGSGQGSGGEQGSAAAAGADAGKTAGSGGPSPDASVGQSQGAETKTAAHPVTAYRPEGLPDHLTGKTNEETIDRLFKAFDGYRRGDAERGVVPKEVAGYAFDASDKLKPYVANFDKDPLFRAVKDKAHAAGLTDKQFKAFVPAVLEDWIATGLIEAPVDGNAQLAELLPESARNLPEPEQKAAIERRITTNIAWADQAGANKILPEGVSEFLSQAAASDPRAHKLIEWLRGASRETTPAMGGRAAANTSEADLAARLKDPRYDHRSPKYDRAFVSETDGLFRKHYG